MGKAIGELASVEFVGNAIGRSLNYGLIVLIANEVGAAGLGIFTAGLVMLRFTSSFARLGMDTAAKRFIPPYVDQDEGGYIAGIASFALATAFGVGSAIALGLYFLQDHVRQFFGGADEPTFVLFLVSIPFLAVLQVTRASTHAFGETKYGVYIREIGQTGIAFVLVLVLTTVGHGTTAIVASYLVSLVVGAALGVVFLRQLGAFRQIRSAVVEVHRIYRFALPAMATALAYPIINWADVAMLSILSTAESIGQYQAAFQTGSLILFALVSVNAAFPPIASRLYQNNQFERLATLYVRTTKWILALALFAAGFFVIYGEPVMSLFGADFENATFLLYVVVVGQAVAASVGPAGVLLTMTEYERLESVNTVCMAGINVLLNYWLINRYDALGAALATTVSISLLNIVRVGEISYIHGVRPYNQNTLKVVPPLIVSYAAMLAVRESPLNPLVELFFGGGVAFALFGLAAYAIVVSEEDRALLQQIG